MSYKEAAAPNAKQRPPIPVAYSKRLKQDSDDFIVANIGLQNNISK